MAPFTSQCGKCKTKFNINNPDMLGKKTKCKKCGAPMLLKPMESGSDEEGSLTDEIKSLKPIASRKQSQISRKMKAVEKEGGDKKKKPKAVKHKADKQVLVISLVTTVVILFFLAGFLSLYYFSPGSSIEKEPDTIEASS